METIKFKFFVVRSQTGNDYQRISAYREFILRFYIRLSGYVSKKSRFLFLRKYTEFVTKLIWLLTFVKITMFLLEIA